jgi:hypothetical protein
VAVVWRGDVEAQFPPTPPGSCGVLMGVASSELAIVEGRQASSPTDRPSQACGGRGKARKLR